MDTTNHSAYPSIASRAPLRIGAYGLVVRDLDRLVDFYSNAVGLAVLDRTARSVRLGIDGVVLLELQHRPDALPDDAATAGLFHTAFLMPTRQHLAEWYRHSTRIGLPITRTGDHLVNEAIYFDDPEGNGVECYADRLPETWCWDDAGRVDIDTGKRVDLEALSREAADDGENWQAPAALRIGHINLRVGDYAAAEAFYCGAIGLDHTGRRHIDFAGRPNTITFMSSGRYHHHLATNDFTSRGAGARDPDRSGLAWFAFDVQDATTKAGVRERLQKAGVPISAIPGGLEIQDPWGTRVRFASS